MDKVIIDDVEYVVSEPIDLYDNDNCRNYKAVRFKSNVDNIVTIVWVCVDCNDKKQLERLKALNLKWLGICVTISLILAYFF